MTVTVASILKGPQSKIQRANRHIDELISRGAPLDRALYEIVNEKVPATVIHLKPTRYKLSYRPKQDIPEVFAGIIGDVLGNIRAAFDHLATGIVKTWGTMPSGPLYFPITKRKDLIAHSGLTAIEQAIPGSRDLFLKEIRPDGGPNEHLWDFYTLNKDDKHNDFIPVVTVTDVNNINAVIGTNTFENCGAGFNAAKPQIIFDSNLPISIQDNFNTSIEIHFGSGTPFENEPVVPTLTQISQLASETIDWFGRLIKQTKNIS